MNLYPVLLMKTLRCRDMKQLDQGLTVIHKVRIKPEQFEQLQGLNSVALHSDFHSASRTPTKEGDQSKSFLKLHRALTLCDSVESVSG